MSDPTSTPPEPESTPVVPPAPPEAALPAVPDEPVAPASAPGPAVAPPPAAAPAYAPPPSGGGSYPLSIISLVAGIVGVVGFAVVFIPIVGGILELFIPAAAVVLGFLGKKREPGAPRGFWLTGLVLGFIGLGIAVVSIVGWIILIAVGSASD